MYTSRAREHQLRASEGRIAAAADIARQTGLGQKKNVSRNGRFRS